MLIGDSSRVSESKLRSAADRLLHQGVRPTVERVRQELGGGAPYVLGRMLDRWFRDLAVRFDRESDFGVPMHMPRDAAPAERTSEGNQSTPAEGGHQVEQVSRVGLVIGANTDMKLYALPPRGRESTQRAATEDRFNQTDAARVITEYALRAEIKLLEDQLASAKRWELSQNESYKKLAGLYEASIRHAAFLMEMIGKAAKRD